MPTLVSLVPQAANKTNLYEVVFATVVGGKAKLALSTFPHYCMYVVYTCLLQDKCTIGNWEIRGGVTTPYTYMSYIRKVELKGIQREAYGEWYPQVRSARV